jgi:CHRD domain-containing protein
MTRSAAVLLFMLALPGAAQAQEKYKVRLATVPMDGGMRNTVAGTGAATAVLTGAKLTVNGTFDGLLSPATIADVHRGPAMGVRGSSFAVLTVSKAPKGTLSGSVDLTPEQLQALKKGQLYIQISSEKAPDGNLWGWFVR